MTIKTKKYILPDWLYDKLIEEREMDRRFATFDLTGKCEFRYMRGPRRHDILVCESPTDDCDYCGSDKPSGPCQKCGAE